MSGNKINDGGHGANSGAVYNKQKEAEAKHQKEIEQCYSEIDLPKSYGVPSSMYHPMWLDVVKSCQECLTPGGMKGGQMNGKCEGKGD